MCAELDRFWLVYAKQADGTVGKTEYLKVHAKLSLVLIPDLTYEEAAAAGEEDWAADASGSTSMGREAVFDCLFELADLWCSGISAAEYACFLRKLFKRVTVRFTTSVQGAVTEVPPSRPRSHKLRAYQSFRESRRRAAAGVQLLAATDGPALGRRRSISEHEYASGVSLQTHKDTVGRAGSPSFPPAVDEEGAAVVGDPATVSVDELGEAVAEGETEEAAGAVTATHVSGTDAWGEAGGEKLKSEAVVVRRDTTGEEDGGGEESSGEGAGEGGGDGGGESPLEAADAEGKDEGADWSGNEMPEPQDGETVAYGWATEEHLFPLVLYSDGPLDFYAAGAPDTNNGGTGASGGATRQAASSRLAFSARVPLSSRGVHEETARLAPKTEDTAVGDAVSPQVRGAEEPTERSHVEAAGGVAAEAGDGTDGAALTSLHPSPPLPAADANVPEAGGAPAADSAPAPLLTSTQRVSYNDLAAQVASDASIHERNLAREVSRRPSVIRALPLNLLERRTSLRDLIQMSHADAKAGSSGLGTPAAEGGTAAGGEAAAGAGGEVIPGAPTSTSAPFATKPNPIQAPLPPHAPPIDNPTSACAALRSRSCHRTRQRCHGRCVRSWAVKTRCACGRRRFGTATAHLRAERRRCGRPIGIWRSRGPLGCIGRRARPTAAHRRTCALSGRPPDQ